MSAMLKTANRIAWVHHKGSGASIISDQFSLWMGWAQILHRPV